MAKLSDDAVDMILAEHGGPPRDVDEALGIGKRVADEIKVGGADPKREGKGGQQDRKGGGDMMQNHFIKAEARSIYEGHDLGGQDYTYNRIPKEIKEPAEEEPYTYISTGYPVCLRGV
ncbi:hypothetical protein HOY80DRAFT_1040229 [Tuber brumale]|nr:hypothetical protein HOY80DRAFT_1040229 [Tuber brumale]